MTPQCCAQNLQKTIMVLKSLQGFKGAENPFFPIYFYLYFHSTIFDYSMTSEYCSISQNIIYYVYKYNAIFLYTTDSTTQYSVSTHVWCLWDLHGLKKSLRFFGCVALNMETLADPFAEVVEPTLGGFVKVIAKGSTLLIRSPEDEFGNLPPSGTLLWLARSISRLNFSECLNMGKLELPHLLFQECSAQPLLFSAQNHVRVSHRTCAHIYHFQILRDVQNKLLKSGTKLRHPLKEFAHFEKYALRKGKH